MNAQPACTGNCEITDGESILIAIDGNGDGSLSVENGDALSVSDLIVVGFQGPDEGSLVVDGDGSLVELGSSEGTFFLVGTEGATGTVTVANGGSIINNGSALNPSGDLTAIRMGSDGFGTFNVLSGGSLVNQSTTGFADINIGIYFSEALAGPSWEGTFNVDGPGSSVEVLGATGASIGVGLGFIENPASGELNITNGGTVLVQSDSGNSFVNVGLGATGTLRIDGQGSVMTIAGTTGESTLTIGLPGGTLEPDDIPLPGQGTLEVRNSGLVEIFSTNNQSDVADHMLLGFGQGTGTALVDSGGIIRVANGYIGIAENGPQGDEQSGTLIVNDTGRVEVVDLFVGSTDFAPGSRNAFLYGTGTISATRTVVTGRGLINPGSTPGAVGSLRIEGDIFFQEDAVLEIDALENGNGDRLVVTGTADLNGQVRSLSPDGEWSVARDYVILTADGGIDGEFDEVTSNLPYLTPTLSYTENSVRLSLSRLGGEVQEEVLEESSAQQLSVNSRVVPVVIQNQVATTIGAAFSTGSSPAVVHTPGSITTGLAAGDDESSGNIWANLTPSDYRTDAIVPGSNTTQSIEGDGLNFLIGADQLIGDRFVVGLFAGAESSDVDIVEIRGEQEVDGLLLGAYGGVALGQYFYLSGNGNYTWLENEIEEQAFGNPEPVTGKFDSERYSLGIDLNAVKVFERFDLRGVLGYNYSKEKFDSYETSIGDVASPRDARLGRARLAVSSSYLGEVLNPYLSAAYEYDVETSNETLDDDGFVLAAGVRGRAMDQRLTMEAYFSGVVDRATQEQYLLGLNVHYAW